MRVVEKLNMLCVFLHPPGENGQKCIKSSMARRLHRIKDYLKDNI